MTFSKPMKRLSSNAIPPFEFWDYFSGIPTADFEGHDCSAGSVAYVYENSTGHFQHVLINSEGKNIFMALILDIQARNVFGHRLLNLNREYGLEQS